MKSRHIGIIVFTLSIAACCFAQNSILGSYIAEGLQHNESIKQQRFLLDKNLYALKEARSLFFPSATVSAVYTRADGGRTIDFPVGTLLNPVYATLNAMTSSNSFPRLTDQHILVNPNDYYDAKIHITMPIVNAEIYFNQKIKKELVTLQQAEVNVYKRELLKEIKIGYFKYLQASQAVAIYKNALRLVKENERINHSLFDNGKVNRTAVIRAGNEVKKIEAALNDAAETQRSAQAYFNFLLNKPLESEIVRDEQPIDTTLISRISEKTITQRDELVKLEAAHNIQMDAKNMAWSFVVPKIGAFLDVGSQGFDWKYNDKTKYYFAGLSLEWNLFSSGRDYFKTQEALADVRGVESQTKYVEHQLRLQLSTAISGYKSSITTYESAIAQVESAEKYYNDIQKLYKEGQALYIELLDAQNQFINAQLQESIAKSAVLIKIAEVERAAASFTIDQ